MYQGRQIERKIKTKRKKSKQNENKSMLSISVNSETGMAKFYPAVSIDGVKVAQVSNWKDFKCKELITVSRSSQKRSEKKMAPMDLDFCVND